MELPSFNLFCKYQYISELKVGLQMIWNIPPDEMTSKSFRNTETLT